MRGISRFVAAMALMAATACGGDDDNGPTNPNPNPSGGNRTMSATIDGSAWTAASVGVSTSNQLLIIAGADLTGRTIGIGVSMLPGTGTQTINQTTAATANVIIGGNSWVAAVGVGSGSITLTTLTANHAVGTFNFTAAAQAGTTTPATRVVTNGRFDVTWP